MNEGVVSTGAFFAFRCHARLTQVNALANEVRGFMRFFTKSTRFTYFFHSAKATRRSDLRDATYC
jgi:hypothetical protein